MRAREAPLPSLANRLRPSAHLSSAGDICTDVAAELGDKLLGMAAVGLLPWRVCPVASLRQRDPPVCMHSGQVGALGGISDMTAAVHDDGS